MTTVDSSPDRIATQMRLLRQRRGLSLAQAARHTGIEAVVLGSWERGDRQPALPRLREWAEAFGLRLMVVGDAGDITDPTDPAGLAWIEHAVRYGEQALIVCDSAAEATEIASHMPGAEAVCRQVFASEWKPAGASR
jgi:transcriptional regulator with XRE-family HTH domain